MKDRFIIAMCLGLALSACEEQAPQPYLKIVGGGFIFNYRLFQNDLWLSCTAAQAPA